MSAFLDLDDCVADNPNAVLALARLRETLIHYKAALMCIRDISTSRYAVDTAKEVLERNSK